MMVDGRNNHTQEVEIDRLLALANLQRMRGQWGEAEGTMRKAEEILPDDPSVLEMLGDILYECGKIEEARDTYQKAHKLYPDKPALEEKFAKMVLEIAEEEREKAIALDMLENPQRYVGRTRKPGMALLLAMIPGMGQFYNQEFVKACVIWGVTLLFFIASGLLQPPYAGVTSLSDLIKQTNPAVLILGFLAFVAYIYGIIDAPLSADKISKSVKKRVEG